MVQGDRPGGLSAAERAAEPRRLGHLCVRVPWRLAADSAAPAAQGASGRRRGLLHGAALPSRPPTGLLCSLSPTSACTSHLHRTAALSACISRAPHLHLPRTSPALHSSSPLHPSLARRPPAVRQTADYPSTPIRGREAIDSCDRQAVTLVLGVVVRWRWEQTSFIVVMVVGR